MSETLYDVILGAIKQEQSNIYTAIPAKVIDFNGHTVTCEAMINRSSKDGEEIAIPPLVDVVVQFPNAGGFCMTVPIKAGDEGLVVFSSRCIDGWYESGNKSKPLDNRTNDLSDGFFIPGTRSKPNKIQDFFHDGASMQTDDGETYIRLTEGTIYIKGDIEHEGNSKQTGDNEIEGDRTHTGDTKQTGNITQLGNTNQVGQFGLIGGFGQSGGADGKAAEFEGTIKAKDIQAKAIDGNQVTSNGVNLEEHTHVDSQGGDTEEPTKGA